MPGSGNPGDPGDLRPPLQRDVRVYIESLPKTGFDAQGRFVRAVKEWESIPGSPRMRIVTSAMNADVIVLTDSVTDSVSEIGPPRSGSHPRRIRFGRTVPWTPLSFESASRREWGHILGLDYTLVPNHVMSINVELSDLPLRLQAEDIDRLQAIWGTTPRK
jgi:hypothetical protein